MSLRSFGPAYAVATRLARPTSCQNRKVFGEVAGLVSVIKRLKLLGVIHEEENVATRSQCRSRGVYVRECSNVCRQRGLGEVLIFLYSAENGNTTNVNLVNTAAHGKAVKVRFIEGENSQEVLDFNLYMSPGDHFSMGVSATADGGGQVVTNDNTCTVPKFTPGEAVAFRSTLYKTDKSAAGATTTFDNTGIGRMAVGYIEVIEMGQLTGKGLHFDDRRSVCQG